MRTPSHNAAMTPRMSTDTTRNAGLVYGTARTTACTWRQSQRRTCPDDAVAPQARARQPRPRLCHVPAGGRPRQPPLARCPVGDRAARPAEARPWPRRASRARAARTRGRRHVGHRRSGAHARQWVPSRRCAAGARGGLGKVRQGYAAGGAGGRAAQGRDLRGAVDWYRHGAGRRRQAEHAVVAVVWRRGDLRRLGREHAPGDARGGAARGAAEGLQHRARR